MVQALAQAQPRQQAARALVALGAANACVDGGYFYVGDGSLVAHQMVALENKAKMLAPQPCQLIGLHLPSFFACNLVAATAGAVQAADDIHQGGFARARRANNGNHLARVHIKANVFEYCYHLIACWVLAHHMAQT